MTNLENAEPAPLVIVAFTDPVCTWCWGSEPVLRKLESWYGPQLKIDYVMGGLVKDIRDFRDGRNGIGGDPEESNAQIARHYREASARHGMPVEVDRFRLFSEGSYSTYPQNIAYKAAQICNPELAVRYLRRIREANAAEGRETGLREVLVELASDVGLDLEGFLKALEDGSAEKAFHADLAITARYGVRGFPTFLLSFQGKDALIRGYQSYASIRAVIASLSNGALVDRAPEKTGKAIMDYLNRYGRAAIVELTTNFEISEEELEALLKELEDSRQILRVSAGNGYFIEAFVTAGNCDPVTGFCGV